MFLSAFRIMTHILPTASRPCCPLVSVWAASSHVTYWLPVSTQPSLSSQGSLALQAIAIPHGYLF